MDMHDNKHCTETAWSCRYHYKDNSACGVNDSPTRVELRVKPRGYPQLAFELPRQRYELDRVEAMMEYAYMQGALDKSREIGALMKKLIAL